MPLNYCNAMSPFPAHHHVSSFPSVSFLNMTFYLTQAYTPSEPSNHGLNTVIPNKPFLY